MTVTHPGPCSGPDCRPCWLAANDPRYRRKWAAPPPAPAPAPAPGGIDPDTYVTRSMLARDASSLSSRLPDDVDLVVAIARSGLLVGPDIATTLHLPLFTVSRQSGLTDPGYGGRMDGRRPRPPRRVLLVDDTTASGREMSACAALVRSAYPHAGLTRAVVYAHPDSLHAVDLYAATYAGPHYLEWNWANAGHGQVAAMDFDGILCPDFTPQQCATRESYLAALSAMPGLHLPRRSPVPLVVSGRPEFTRSATLAWLARRGVSVRELVLWPGDLHPPAAEVAPWKARYFAASGLSLFVESDPEQARIIQELTGGAVLCPALGRVLRGPKHAKPKRRPDPNKPRVALGQRPP